MKLIAWMLLILIAVYCWYLVICFIGYILPKLPVKLLEFIHNLF